MDRPQAPGHQPIALRPEGRHHELHRAYRLGSSLRAYLNGALVIQTTDTTHASGRTGAMTYKAAADFDDYLAYQP